MSLEKFLSETAGVVIIGLLIYILGWLSNEVIDRFFSKSRETKLKQKTKVSIDTIYEAESAIPGKGRGAERLAYACKIYMAKTGEKKYHEAQKQILAVFPLTKLSK